MINYNLDNKKITLLSIYDGSALYISCFVIQMLLQFILMVVLMITEVPQEFTSTLYYLMIVTIINEGSCILSGLAYWKIKGENVFKGTGFKWNLNIFQTLILVVIGIFMLFAFQAIATVVSQAIIDSGYNSSILNFQIKTVGDLIIGIIFMAIIPALCEEILYRGFIGRSFKSKNYIFGIFMTGLLFALMHLNPMQLVYQFILGCVCCFVYYLTRCIYSSMIIHFTSNFIVVLLNYLENMGKGFVLNVTQTVILSLVSMVIFILLLVLFYIVSLKRKSLDFRNVSLSKALKITFETEDEKKIEDIKKINLQNALEGLSSDEAKEIFLKNEKDVELKFKKKDNRALIYSFLLAGAMLIINTLTGYLQ